MTNVVTSMIQFAPGVNAGFSALQILGPHSTQGGSDYNNGSGVGGNVWTIDGAFSNGNGRNTSNLPSVIWCPNSRWSITPSTEVSATRSASASASRRSPARTISTACSARTTGASVGRAATCSPSRCTIQTSTACSRRATPRARPLLSLNPFSPRATPTCMASPPRGPSSFRT